MRPVQFVSLFVILSPATHRAHNRFFLFYILINILFRSCWTSHQRFVSRFLFCRLFNSYVGVWEEISRMCPREESRAIVYVCLRGSV